MRAHARDDGLYDVDAHLVDRKPFAFSRLLSSQPVPAGRPLHDVRIRLTVDEDLVVRAIEASSDVTLRLPARMLADYAELTASGKVWVAELAGRLVGVLVQYETAGFYIDTVAVSPASQKTASDAHFAEAEALRRGFRAIYLCTNSAMTENLLFYPRIG